jgi:hypothetical protein
MGSSMSAFEYINQLQSLAIYKYLAINHSCKGDVHYADTRVTAVRQGGRSYGNPQLLRRLG